MVKIFRWWLLTLVALLIFPKTVAAQVVDEISSFHADITINQDTSITVAEKIEYETNLDKHGIYRYIPYIYNRDGQKSTLRLSQITITDEFDQPIPFEKTIGDSFVTLKIGDPDRTFSGEKIYFISYQIERAIDQYSDHHELYWDITGEGWQIPVLSSSATISSPFAPIEQAQCFSGAVGTNDGLCQSNFGGERATFRYDQEINYGDNLTILLGFPATNALVFPTPRQLLWLWIRDNWPLFLSPLPLLLIWWRWYHRGRDHEFLSANVYNLEPDRPTRLRPFSLTPREPLVYAPLADLTPGEAGALLDERVDSHDVVAEILELARKKFLRIELIEAKSLLGKKRDYQLTKLTPSTKKLTAVQNHLLEKLFATGDVIKVSELKGKFYSTMEKARTMIDEALVEKKIYTSSPTTARAIGFGLFLVPLAGVGGLMAMTFFELNIYWPILLLVIQVPFGLSLAYNLPQKTAVGTNLWLQARGLRKSIHYGKWREKIKEKNLFIEEVLPFAVALGVIDQLARDMKDLNLTPPSYVGTTHLTTWNTSQFVRGFSTEVGNTLTYNPSSSSRGGSGFSGGSSGGGGGGGGGGSW